MEPDRTRPSEESLDQVESSIYDFLTVLKELERRQETELRLEEIDRALEAKTKLIEEMQPEIQEKEKKKKQLQNKILERRGKLRDQQTT